jgi:hypothetical protein
VAILMVTATWKAFIFGMARYNIFDDLRRDILYSILTLICWFLIYLCSIVSLSC